MPPDVVAALATLAQNAAFELAERVKLDLLTILRDHERRIGQLEQGYRVVPEPEVAQRLAQLAADKRGEKGSEGAHS
jgi:hypothetical protein